MYKIAPRTSIVYLLPQRTPSIPSRHVSCMRNGIRKRAPTDPNEEMTLHHHAHIEDHFFGLAEHLELQAMVDGGMTPAQALAAATSRAAEVLHLDDRGSLVAGKRADFLVLDASPLDDIVNARRISRLFINGIEIDRAALRAQIKD